MTALTPANGCLDPELPGSLRTRARRHRRSRRTTPGNAIDIAGQSDVSLAGSGDAGDPTLLGRKSLLMGALASMGFVIASAGQSSAATAGVKPVPFGATLPAYVCRWTPATAYARGQQVISPNNDVVSANVTHTSSAAFATDTAKWTISSTFLRQDSVFRLGTAENPVTDPAAARPTGIPVVYWVTPTAPANAVNGDIISLPAGGGATTGTQVTGLCYTVDPRTLRDTGATWPCAGRTYYMRVIGGITGATKYRLWITAASGHISIANFANSGSGVNAIPTGAPRNPTGSVVCPAVGTPTLTPAGGAFNVADGDWIGLSCDNATAAFGGGAPWARANLFLGLSWAHTGFPAASPAGGWAESKPFFVGVE